MKQTIWTAGPRLQDAPNWTLHHRLAFLAVSSACLWLAIGYGLLVLAS